MHAYTEHVRIVCSSHRHSWMMIRRSEPAVKSNRRKERKTQENDNKKTYEEQKKHIECGFFS